MRLLILGLGYSAQQFVKDYGREFAEIAATSRNWQDKPSLSGITPLTYRAGASQDLPAVAKAMAKASHLLISIAPCEGDVSDPVLADLQPQLAQNPPQWIGYLSTIGVYGDQAGRWVDETTPPKPGSPRSRARLIAENSWIDFARNHPIALTIFRLSGIYGPRRNVLQKLHAGKARRLMKPGQVFNRIQVEDIAGALWAAMKVKRNEPGIDLVNVTDDYPAPPQDVVAYAARKLRMAPPPPQNFATANISPMARSFYGENKRVRNDRLKSAYGYELKYPDYTAGIDALLKSEMADMP